MASALSIVQHRFPQVTKVVDAPLSLWLDVEPGDLKKSKSKDHENCALAAACKRKYKPDGVMVSLSTAYVIKGHTATRYHVPPYAQREIVSFDRHSDFEPGTYELKAPPVTDHLQKRAKSRGLGGSHGPANKGLQKRFRHKTKGVRAALTTKQ